jgi:hypothetical protein
MWALLLVAGCGNPRHDCPSLAELGLDDGATLADGSDTAPAFALGVEYSELGLADTYARSGVGWTKTRLEAFAWGAVEPRRPRGGEHDYDWGCTDAEVASWQQAGVTRLQSYLSPENTWGQRGRKDLRPKDRYAGDYADWVRALIERYDGDGVDDMPGLLRPVDDWVVGGEWTGFWPDDDAGHYLELLEATAGAARAGSDTARIGAIPLMLLDVFQGHEPSDAEIEARLEEEPTFRNSGQGALDILDRPDLFDYVDVHSLGDYSELPPLKRWLDDRMAERGYSAPVWIDDAFPMSILDNDGHWPTTYPVADEAQGQEIFQILMRVADDTASDDEIAWLRGLCVRGTVHKAITALGEGYVGINLGNTEDWLRDDGRSLRETMTRLIGASAAMGMIDVAHDDGYDIDDPRAPGDTRPAFDALKLVVDELSALGLEPEGGGEAWAALSVAPIGGLTGARGYRLESGGQILWVLWSEDGVLQLPGEEEQAEDYALDVGVDGEIALASPPVAPGQDVARWTGTASGGSLSLSLTSTPVFVGPVTAPHAGFEKSRHTTREGGGAPPEDGSGA